MLEFLVLNSIKMYAVYSIKPTGSEFSSVKDKKIISRGKKSLCRLNNIQNTDEKIRRKMAGHLPTGTYINRKLINNMQVKQ